MFILSRTALIFVFAFRYRLSSYSMPCQREYQHVEDACLVGDTVVLGYGDGPCQISLITLVEV
jgi:hypothetical protein